MVTDFLQPGLRYHPPHGPLDLISLSLIFAFGTAGLPHVLVRFYTVPDAKTARQSVVWAMILIGSFYVMTSILGLGRPCWWAPITSSLMAAQIWLVRCWRGHSCLKASVGLHEGRQAHRIS